MILGNGAEKMSGCQGQPLRRKFEHFQHTFTCVLEEYACR